MTDRVEALSINGWDADMFRKGIALGKLRMWTALNVYHHVAHTRPV